MTGSTATATGRRWCGSCAAVGHRCPHPGGSGVLLPAVTRRCSCQHRPKPVAAGPSDFKAIGDGTRRVTTTRSRAPAAEPAHRLRAEPGAACTDYWSEYERGGIWLKHHIDWAAPTISRCSQARTRSCGRCEPLVRRVSFPGPQRIMSTSLSYATMTRSFPRPVRTMSACVFGTATSALGPR